MALAQSLIAMLAKQSPELTKFALAALANLAKRRARTSPASETVLIAARSCMAAAVMSLQT
jgi:hypothetical protein